MLFKENEIVRLYRAFDPSDEPYIGQDLTIVATNEPSQRCACDKCTYNWSAGGRMIPQADYVLDISPGSNSGDVLLVYEWQLIKPDEKTTEIEKEEELTCLS